MFKSFHSRHSPESISHLKKKICHHQTHSDLFLFPDGMSSVFMSQLYSDHNFSLDLIRPQLANFPTKYFMYFTKQIVARGMYQSNVLRIQKTNLSINLPGLPVSVVLVLECICLSWILPSDKEAGRKEKCNTYSAVATSTCASAWTQTFFICLVLEISKALIQNIQKQQATKGTWKQSDEKRG